MSRDARAWLEDGSAARRRIVLLLSFGGVAFLVIQGIVGMQIGLFPVPSGDEAIWNRVGDDLWRGVVIYYNGPAPMLRDSFFYAPPLAVVFGTISWLPPELQHWLFVAVRLGALRYIAGSWIGAGVACWFPLVAFDVWGGNFNLPVAAAIVAAVHGRPGWALWGAFAKFGPVLAINPRDLRKLVVPAAVAIAVTLPWLHLWPEWAGHLLGNLGVQIGPQVPVPLPLRLVAAAVLLLFVRTGWARALAATIAIPAFYWASLVILLAPLAVFLRDRAWGARGRTAEMVVSPA